MNKTRVIEGRVDIRNIARSLKLIKDKGYSPQSASDLVRTVFLILGNEAKNRVDVGDFESTESAIIYLRKHGISQKSKDVIAEKALLEQLQFENEIDMEWASSERRKEDVDDAMKELTGKEGGDNEM